MAGRCIAGGRCKCAGSGSCCHAIVRAADGKVAEVNSGGNDDFVGREDVCAPTARRLPRAHDKDPEVKTVNNAFKGPVAPYPIGG